MVPKHDETSDAERVGSYMAALPEDQRRSLQQLRLTLMAAAPGAIDAISYSMPALRLNGRVLVYYAAFKNHLSLFPASGAVIDRLRDQLGSHAVTKGTIHFTPDDPLPPELVRRIVALRIEELATRGR